MKLKFAWTGILLLFTLLATLVYYFPIGCLELVLGVGFLVGICAVACFIIWSIDTVVNHSTLFKKKH
jgi:hypothetical protein